MIIYINARFLTQPISGVQRYAIECCRQIKKLFPKVIFLAPNSILLSDVAKEFEVKIIGKNKGHVWEQIDLWLFMKNAQNAPLLNLCNTAPLLYNNNYLTIHDLAFYHHPEWNSKLFATWYNFLIPMLAKRSKHIFTVSQTIQIEIEKAYHIPKSKISVTYNGIGENLIYSNGFKQDKEKFILSVGTINLRKNQQTLVDAFIASSLKNIYQLVIIGDTNPIFKDCFDKRYLDENNIAIVSKITNEDLVNFYKKAEIVISVSLYEGFGIPLLEGLFYGCKLVCSNINVYKELFREYAVFCNPMDINDINRALMLSIQSGYPIFDKVVFNQYNYKVAANIILKDICK